MASNKYAVICENCGTDVKAQGLGKLLAALVDHRGDCAVVLHGAP